MRKTIDPLGGMLMAEGVLEEHELSDVLEQQRLGLPFASLCYLLGYGDEYTLVRALCRQVGMPGVVLSQSIVSLHNLRDVPREIALRYNILPIFEDRHHVFVAIADYIDPSVVNELAIITGKTAIPHVAIQICLARTIRDCYRIYDRGDAYWFGDETSFEDLNDAQGLLAAVSDVDELPSAVEAEPLDVTDPNLAVPVDPADVKMSASGVAGMVDGEVEDDTFGEELDLGSREALPTARRILLVDSDESVRRLMVSILEPEGHHLVEADSGVEAVQRIRQDPPDLAIIEVMLPKFQGYQICRSIKSSQRYGHIPVVLISAAGAGESRNRDLVERYNADAVITKPLSQSELLGAVNRLLARPAKPRPSEGADQRLFDEAIEAYRNGLPEAAVESLRRSLEIDPLSARSHFVLGNILQSQKLDYEAISAYEQTVSLRPDYFPALSRLAYLEYKQGFLSRALQTWRRSLKHCPDEDQAKTIKNFMESLERELARRSKGFIGTLDTGIGDLAQNLGQDVGGGAKGDADDG